MLGKEAVVEVMKMCNMSAATLARDLNYKTTSGVTERLYGKHDMRADTLAKFLSEMHCELVVRSTLKGHQEWIIDGKSDKKSEDETK